VTKKPRSATQLKQLKPCLFPTQKTSPGPGRAHLSFLAQVGQRLKPLKQPCLFLTHKASLVFAPDPTQGGQRLKLGEASSPAHEASPVLSPLPSQGLLSSPTGAMAQT